MKSNPENELNSKITCHTSSMLDEVSKENHDQIVTHGFQPFSGAVPAPRQAGLRRQSRAYPVDQRKYSGSNRRSEGRRASAEAPWR